MMEFTECLRGEGLEIMDPMVDSEGFQASKEKFGAAYEVYEEIIEGFTFEQEKNALNEQVESPPGRNRCGGIHSTDRCRLQVSTTAGFLGWVLNV